MNTAKKLGIWMDHTSAHILPFTHETAETATTDSETVHEHSEPPIGKGDNLIHNKEQGQLAAYYKELGEVIRGYDEVLLFGPTDAKVELFNILKEDSHFEKVKIAVEQTDKMTENQLHAFVKAHFSPNENRQS